MRGKYSEMGITILIIALFAADLKAFYSIKTVRIFKNVCKTHSKTFV